MEIVKGGLKDRNFYRLYILGVLMVLCSLFYYFGQIVDFLGWEALRWSGFYVVHDVHRLLFLAPILYAAYAYGMKATIIVSLVSGAIWMPRGLFISPYPSPVLRAMLFLVAEGGVGYLVARVLWQNQHIRALEKMARMERDRLQRMVSGLSDGVVVIGPDFKVRFANESMKQTFGDPDGLPCYKYIYHLAEPCGKNCRLAQVLKGEPRRWEYSFPDGSTYEIMASPCTDVDGTHCQIAVLRDVTHFKTADTTW
jgi:PAS domain-containing protein